MFLILSLINYKCVKKKINNSSIQFHISFTMNNGSTERKFDMFHMGQREKINTSVEHA